MKYLLLALLTVSVFTSYSNDRIMRSLMIPTILSVPASMASKLVSDHFMGQLKNLINQKKQIESEINQLSENNNSLNTAIAHQLIQKNIALEKLKKQISTRKKYTNVTFGLRKIIVPLSNSLISAKTLHCVHELLQNYSSQIYIPAMIATYATILIVCGLDQIKDADEALDNYFSCILYN